MTPALLKQALEAAQAVIDRWETPLWKDAEPTANVIVRLREVVSALTAFDSLSDYDKAIQALADAGLIPDWVNYIAQDGFEGNTTFFRLKPKFFVGAGEWDSHADDEHCTVIPLQFPRCEKERASLRRITHNSDGTVTVERG